MHKMRLFITYSIYPVMIIDEESFSSYHIGRDEIGRRYVRLSQQRPLQGGLCALGGEPQ